MYEKQLKEKFSKVCRLPILPYKIAAMLTCENLSVPAEDMYEKQLAENPNDLDTLYNYGRFLWKVQKDLPAAEGIYLYICVYVYMYIHINVHMQIFSIPPIIMVVSLGKFKKTCLLQKVNPFMYECFYICIYIYIHTYT